MRQAVARPNSTIQSLNDDSIHDWYRFVLAYPDHLVTDMLDHFGVRQGQIVLDPFVGTGTTLIECKRRGFDSIGIDANPVTAFASRVKTTWDIDLKDFRERRSALIAHIREAQRQIGEENSRQLGFSDLTSPAVSNTYDLPQPIELLPDLDAFRALIPLNAISDLPLRKLLIARQAVESFPHDAITDLFRLALASIAVSDLSNLGFGPEVYVKQKKRHDADLLATLAQKLDKIEADLTGVQQLSQIGSSTVHTWDARNLSDFIVNPVDFVITSPPYPNEKDYTRTTRLELVLLGFIRDRTDLRTIKEDMLRSHTRNIFKSDNDSQYVLDIPEITTLSTDIEKQRIKRGATSGFERFYHRVVTEYFGGMYRVFEQLERVMPVGGKLAIVVGDQMSYFQVPIRTAQLLGITACRTLRFREIETRLWRTRLATSTRHDVEEHILILERC